MIDTLGAAAVMVGVPAGAVPSFGVTIVQYVNRSGDEVYKWVFHGTTSYSSMLGLMGMLEHRMMHDADGDD